MSQEESMATEENEAAPQVTQEESLKDEAKNFAQSVTHSSVRIHGMAYSSLTKLLERTDDVPETYVKALVKLSVSASIRRYSQPASFRYVKKLLQVLSDKDYSCTIKSLAQTINLSLPIVSNITESVALSQIPTIKWLLSLLSNEKFKKLDNEDKKLMVSSLTILSYYAAANVKSWNVFNNNLSKALRANDELKSTIESEIGSISKENSERGLTLICAVAKSTDSEFCSSIFADIFTKTCLLSKTRPTNLIIEASKDSLKKISAKVFADELLPNIKKGLLRGPEVSIHGILAIVENVNFSLNEYSIEILKAITGSLQSADEVLKTAAINVAVGLTVNATQEVVAKVVSTFLDQLSAAKTAENRIALLNGVSRIAKVTKCDDLDKISEDVIKKTTKVDKETHDGTIEAQWQAASNWADRQTTPSPSLINAFKEATKQQAPIKCIVYRQLFNILENNKSLDSKLGEMNVKAILSESECSPKGELSSIGIGALLLKLLEKGSSEYEKTWMRAANAESLFKEKFVAAQKTGDAVAWSKLVEKLILEPPKNEKKGIYPPAVLKSLTLLLFWPDWEVRKEAMESLKKVLSVEKALFAEALAEFIFAETVNGNVDNLLRKVGDMPATWCVPGDWYVQVLRILLSPTEPELDKLAIHTLLLASLKRLVEVDGSVWLRWIHENDSSWRKEQSFRDQVVQKVLKCENRDVRNTALITIVLLNDVELKNALWKHVESSIKEINIADYSKISENDIAIFKCGDGQLYNTSVLDLDEAAGVKSSKGGSYEDHLAEIQLIREMAEKRRKEGKLSAKQKQAMEKELESEKEIRDEVRTLYNTAEWKLDEVKALVNADHAGAFMRPEILFDYCMPLTRTKLIGKEASQLFLAYRDAAFSHSDDYLEQLVGSCWLRVIGSNHKIEGWCEEKLPAALKRMFSLLNERAFVVDTGDDDDDDAMLFDDEIIGPSQLTLLYPLIKIILTNTKGYGEEIRNESLLLLKNAINRKFLRDRDVLQLPMEHYASLMFEYYATHLESYALKATHQLVRIANATNDMGPRVLGMISEILTYLCHDNPDVRVATLDVLSAPQLLMRIVVECGQEDKAIETLVRIFVARFDDFENVSKAADDLWSDNNLQIRASMALPLVDECVSSSELVRCSASRALLSFVEQLPKEMMPILTHLKDTYTDLAEIREAVYDEVGRLKKEAVDEWQKRSGVGKALLLLATVVDSEDAEFLIKIVVPAGLNDRVALCRNDLRNAAVEVIRRHGAQRMKTLLPFLQKLSDETPDIEEFDNQRQGLVVVLGTLAQYIDSTDKVKAIVARLVEALSTPSEAVQESVSRCLPPLVPKIPGEDRDLLGKMEQTLFDGSTYGVRRGAAYGIAGLIKGMGMLALKDIDLLTSIKKNLEDKKSNKHREGGLLALEILCSSIGKLFEPYMIKALPSLLLTFGDNDADVRRAAEDTAKAMMAAMTVYGTKLVLPSLLEALDDESWRTKCAATELLGSMAFCAPRQLSSCLPSIVPKIIEVLADSSTKVQKSGEKALQQIAKVVRNPEIIGVTNQLMAGLIDPANKTSAALQAVLNTKFIHYIDAPSLALLMPIVRRAFEDRNSETRRVAAQIIANIYSLCENKDMEPYLPNMVPGLQRSLLDPVPEIRTVSARALGAVVSKSGGNTSAKLRSQVVPWLKEKLVSPQSTVDRSGAAQGLCEVLAGSGEEQLEYVMPDIIETTESTDVSAETRDGYLLMYIYLPMVFGERFVPYLPRVVPPILKALADENEYVRASALKAGQRLIQQFCSHARKHLLPQLQLALMDENWRIRHASVQLIGDFLFNISGISGKSTSSTANEDDTMGIEQAGKTIVRALGQKDRDRVLAGLYLVRSDIALIVRQAAGHVWKMVVTNTPRTLKEITKILFEMVVDSLASSCEDRQQMGARCLGELVRKMGDKVLNEILPVLETNQKSDDVAKRIGVALALNEIIENMSKEVLNHYLQSIVGPVRNAICDENENVREAAADTFTVLYHVVGNEALDEIITPLLEKLTPEEDYILSGLCDVMKQNSRSMLPYLLPKLTKPPVNVHALCSLSAVAGDSLSRQLPKVLDALLASCVTNSADDPMIESCEKVVTAVTDEDGIPVLVDYLTKRAGVDHNVPAAVLLSTFISKSGVNLSYLAEELLPGLLQLYSSESDAIVEHTIIAAIALTQSMDQKELQSVLPATRKSINIMVSSAKKKKQIRGFAHPKGLNPLIGVLRECILQGGTEMKEMAAECLGMIVSVCDVVALKAHVVNITGPLIRVLGDRFSAGVKLPIIETLSKLLSKVDVMLKPFLPQLQSTFLKSLQDASSKLVRLAAGGALARLMKLHPKPEGTVLEIVKLLSVCQDLPLLETSLATLTGLVSVCGSKLQQSTIDEICRVSETIFSTQPENMSDLDNSLTACSGALLGETLATREDWPGVEKLILADMQSNKAKTRVRQAKALGLQQACRSNAEGLWGSEVNASCRAALLAGFTASDAMVACASLRAAAHVLVTDVDRDLLAALARAINHQSIEVRKATSVALGHIGKAHDLPNDVLKLIVPHLVNGCKESNSAVRSASELALVYSLKMTENEEKFENYLNCLEGIVQKNLAETRVSLLRAIRSGDIELESLDTTLSVC